MANAAVNNSPNGISRLASFRNAGSVCRGLTLENHHSKASGANTPIHSYQAHAEMKKNVRDNRHSRAGPSTGEKPKRNGRPIMVRNAGAGAAGPARGCGT